MLRGYRSPFWALPYELLFLNLQPMGNAVEAAGRWWYNAEMTAQPDLFSRDSAKKYGWFVSSYGNLFTRAGHVEVLSYAREKLPSPGEYWISQTAAESLGTKICSGAEGVYLGTGMDHPALFNSSMLEKPELCCSESISHYRPTIYGVERQPADPLLWNELRNFVVHRNLVDTHWFTLETANQIGLNLSEGADTIFTHGHCIAPLSHFSNGSLLGKSLDMPLLTNYGLRVPYFLCAPFFRYMLRRKLVGNVFVDRQFLDRYFVHRLPTSEGLELQCSGQCSSKVFFHCAETKDPQMIRALALSFARQRRYRSAAVPCEKQKF